MSQLVHAVLRRVARGALRLVLAQLEENDKSAFNDSYTEPSHRRVAVYTTYMAVSAVSALVMFGGALLATFNALLNPRFEILLAAAGFLVLGTISVAAYVGGWLFPYFYHHMPLTRAVGNTSVGIWVWVTGAPGVLVWLLWIYALYVCNNVYVTPEMAAVRVGHVTPTEVRIFAMFPGHTGTFDLALARRTGNANYEVVDTQPADSHATARFKATGLLPGTAYEYDVRADEVSIGGGAFVTASAAPKPFAVGVGSGIQHSDWGRWFGGVQHPWASFERLHPVSLFVLAGNAVYADGSFHPPTSDLYTNHYTRLYAEPGFRDFARRTPIYSMFGEHEIRQSWDQHTAPPYAAAVDQWTRYLGGTNPSSLRGGEHYYAFERNDVHFFILDTRTHRSRNRQEDGPTHTLLGSAQREALQKWLLDHPNAMKLVVSPSPVTDNLPMNSDSWASRATERTGLLDFLENNNITGTLFVSGGASTPFVDELRPRIFEVGSGPFAAAGDVLEPSTGTNSFLWTGRRNSGVVYRMQAYHTILDVHPVHREVQCNIYAHHQGNRLVYSQIFIL